MSVITSKRIKTPMNPLDKRIPRNPKYENVQTTLDTGDSMTKFLKRNEELRASSKQQVGEIFKRMKISTLVQLIIQVSEINSVTTPKPTDFDPIASDRTLTDLDRPQTTDSQMSVATTRSTLQSVIRGVGEMDVNKNSQNRSSIITPVTPKTPMSEHLNLEYDERPYLIVDLRDKDEFRTNHIVSAHHYPAAMLSRCSNNESRELLIYKNHKGKIIVLYDDDERIAPQAATIMMERGYNNIFLLSGGLKYAVHKFPRGLLTGTCPLSWTTSSASRTSSSAKTKRPPSTATNRQEAPVGQSLASTIQPTQGPVVTFDTREQFTREDIEDLNQALEKILLPQDNRSRSSRPNTSASTTSSRFSMVSERSNFSNVSDKAWKP
ncbi:unnamed protein product [Adineta steineri]|uniref:Rhodanese domain-containing protein n=1 Tax=Adineta steineri TaxID=433720 RepID=A0A814N2B1_9BILA|nr:unnamed protein product [Adineta steineri]CAF1144335.1 unnamed protein product [Adineta steineri]